MTKQPPIITTPFLNQSWRYASPFIIIIVNCIVALLFGHFIGKWAFVPIILIEWGLFLFFIYKSGQSAAIKKWLTKPSGSIWWLFLCLFISSGTLLIFMKHYHLLNSWQIIIPWLIIALVNPFMEEFYWRGFLLNTASKWNSWLVIIVTSLLFAVNHYVFAINSALFRGLPVFISTFLMGVVWSLTYKKTNSVVWTIIAHFFVDFLNLSVPSFLDMYEAGW